MGPSLERGEVRLPTPQRRGFRAQIFPVANQVEEEHRWIHNYSLVSSCASFTLSLFLDLLVSDWAPKPISFVDSSIRFPSYETEHVFITPRGFQLANNWENGLWVAWSFFNLKVWVDHGCPAMKRIMILDTKYMLHNNEVACPSRHEEGTFVRTSKLLSNLNLILF